jgi:hypothetical protein
MFLFRTPTGRIRKETFTDIIIKMLNIQNKEKIFESLKREATSHM